MKKSLGFLSEKRKNCEGLRSMHTQLLSGYHGQQVACEEKQ